MGLQKLHELGAGPGGRVANDVDADAPHCITRPTKDDHRRTPFHMDFAIRRDINARVA
ncbi:hypothetical protein [Streptomyces sp.]|uniref:hypothetical protein n=1 Tax=Streptomyces sp. TaxID=1931 RepID=UPI002F943F61